MTSKPCTFDVHCGHWFNFLLLLFLYIPCWFSIWLNVLCSFIAVGVERQTELHFDRATWVKLNRLWFRVGRFYVDMYNCTSTCGDWLFQQPAKVEQKSKLLTTSSCNVPSTKHLIDCLVYRHWMMIFNCGYLPFARKSILNTCETTKSHLQIFLNPYRPLWTLIIFHGPQFENHCLTARSNTFH